MRTIIAATSLLLTIACGQPAKQPPHTAKDTITTAVPVSPASRAARSATPPADTVRIMGDFNGDGTPDTAISILHAKAVEENTQDHYIVLFSDKVLPPLRPVTGRQRLVNEGDLNGDGADELSLFGEPLHGCTYSMQTFSYRKGSWQPLTEMWLIPTACVFLSDEQLQQRVFLENDTLYHLREDVNDENMSLVKQPLPLQ